MESAFEPYAVSIKQTSLSENICVSEVYNRLKRGEYVALKDGRRTLVLWSSVKARRSKLKPAKFGNPRPRNFSKIAEAPRSP